MNFADAAAVYAGSVAAQAAYYGGKKIWSLPGWLPPSILVDIKGFYRLNNNGSGGLSLVDTSGQNNLLTNINNVSLGSGVLYGAASFSSNQYLRAFSTNSFSLSSSYTISLWVNISAFKNHFCLVGGNRIGTTSGTIAIYGDSAGSLYLNNGVSEDVKINNFFELNTWTHCVFQRRYFTIGNEVKEFWIYKNGNLVSIESSKLSANAYNSSELYFGRFPGRLEEDYQFDGLIDAIGIWSNQISQSHVVQLYNGGAALEI